MEYILRHFDTPLMRFSLHREGLQGLQCSILWADAKKQALCPIGLAPTAESMLAFLRTRTIPKNRWYVEAILSSMGLRENDLDGILQACLGLSLNDSCWIVPPEFTGTFAEYNLYDHPF